jgi:hypothetical protein
MMDPDPLHESDDNDTEPAASARMPAISISALPCAESESQSAMGLPPKKKTKRDSKWQDGWKQYNIKQSRKGASFVHCNICSTDFSVASGRVHEIKRNIGTKKHCELAKHALKVA